MIAYMCQYAPIEVFHAFGEENHYIEPESSFFEQAESLMHPIVCSFVKCALEDIISADYDGVVLTSCCDSTRRLYDIIKNRYPEKFVFLLELPVKKTPAARKIFANSIGKMIKAYEAFSGKTFQEENLIKAMNAANGQAVGQTGNIPGAVNVGLLGARYSPGVVDLIQRCGANISFNLSGLCEIIILVTYCSPKFSLTYLAHCLILSGFDDNIAPLASTPTSKQALAICFNSSGFLEKAEPPSL